MINIRKITKTFTRQNQEVRALKDVSLQVYRGEIYGIIGLSGAGKSTLLRMINGLERPDKGQVLVGADDICSLSEKTLNLRRKDMGMIFQHFNLLSSRDVYGNIGLPLELKGEDKAARHEKILELVKAVGLSHRLYAPISTLSGGEKQRVAIARALSTSPKILLCDEATSALDPKTTDEILTLLVRLRDTYQLTIVLITHEMAVVKRICDRLAVIEGGQIIEEGPVNEVFDQPSAEATKDFIRVV